METFDPEVPVSLDDYSIIHGVIRAYAQLNMRGWSTPALLQLSAYIMDRVDTLTTPATEDEETALD